MAHFQVSKSVTASWVDSLPLVLRSENERAEWGNSGGWGGWCLKMFVGVSSGSKPLEVSLPIKTQKWEWVCVCTPEMAVCVPVCTRNERACVCVCVRVLGRQSHGNRKTQHPLQLFPRDWHSLPGMLVGKNCPRFSSRRDSRGPKAQALRTSPDDKL